MCYAPATTKAKKARYRMLNWLKTLFTPTLERVKADVIREIDRALEKIRSGQNAREVSTQLRLTLSQLFAKTKLGSGAGGYLLDIVLAQVNWEAFVRGPLENIAPELEKLRDRVKGARL